LVGGKVLASTSTFLQAVSVEVAIDEPRRQEGLAAVEDVCSAAFVAPGEVPVNTRPSCPGRKSP